MSILFLLSNIAIPFLILTYTSMISLFAKKSFFPAKWFLLIVSTFVSNFLHFFMQESKLFLVFDLVLKLGIVFVPPAIEQSLERIIIALKMEAIFEWLRARLLPQFYRLFAIVFRFLLLKLNPKEQLDFKTVVRKVLDSHSQPIPAAVFEPMKKQAQTENTGVLCDLLTIAMLNTQIRQKQLLRVQLNQKSMEVSINQQSQQSQYNSANMSKSTKNLYNIEEPVERTGSMKKKSGFTMQKSNTDFGFLDQQHPQPQKSPNFHHEPVSKKLPTRSSPISVAPLAPPLTPHQQSQPSMILNKLDISQYSDMFEDEEDSSNNKFVAKVEAIIEIAGMSSARLELYNIQLFANGDIKIVSLYGREFERHHLVSMKALKHGYYELKLQDGKVQSRKVKFRGPFEAFLKYLQPEKP